MINYDIKKDEGKPRMDLIPTSVLRSLADVLTFGLTKYNENSWQTVEVNRYHAALLRHLMSWIDDPLGKDEESGLFHSEHLLFNAMAINHLTIEMAEKDKSGKAAAILTHYPCQYCQLSSTDTQSVSMQERR